jgi:hypothetical protein
MMQFSLSTKSKLGTVAGVADPGGPEGYYEYWLATPSLCPAECRPITSYTRTA